MDLETRTNDAISKALDAFWASIAASYPEATTGDVHPYYVMTLESAAMHSVTAWLMVNAPEVMA